MSNTKLLVTIKFGLEQTYLFCFHSEHYLYNIRNNSKYAFVKLSREIHSDTGLCLIQPTGNRKPFCVNNYSKHQTKEIIALWFLASCFEYELCHFTKSLSLFGPHRPIKSTSEPTIQGTLPSEICDFNTNYVPSLTLETPLDMVVKG